MDGLFLREANREGAGGDERGGRDERSLVCRHVDRDREGAPRAVEQPEHVPPRCRALTLQTHAELSNFRLTQNSKTSDSRRTLTLQNHGKMAGIGAIIHDFISPNTCFHAAGRVSMRAQVLGHMIKDFRFRSWGLEGRVSSSVFGFDSPVFRV